MKKFVIKPTMESSCEELAVITLPSCCTAIKADNDIAIFTPSGVAESLANVIEMLDITGVRCAYSNSENKVVLRSKLPTCMKLIPAIPVKEILFTKEITTINGFKAISM